MAHNDSGSDLSTHNPAPESPVVDESVTEELTERFRATAEETVPWFYANMPATYLQDTHPSTQRKHLGAIVAARAAGQPLRFTLKDGGGASWTFIHEESKPGTLSRLLQQLPKERPLASAKVHTSQDGDLVVDVFRFRDVDAPVLIRPERYQAAVESCSDHAAAKLDPAGLEQFKKHLSHAPREYAVSVPAERVLRNFALYNQARVSDDIHVELSEEPGGWVRARMAYRVPRPRILFERVVDHFGKRHIDIHRAYLDVFDSGEEVVAVVGIVFKKDQVDVPNMGRELRRLRWADSRALDLFYAIEDWSLSEAELVMGLACLVQARVGAENRYAYSRERVLHMVRTHQGFCRQLAKTLLDSVGGATPPEAGVLAAQYKDLRATIDAETTDPFGRRFLRLLAKAAEATLYCNIHHPNRYGLAYRLDPQFFARENKETPFGVYFVHGRGFNAFHVRFRDISRGGVRVVHPRSFEEFAQESLFHFDEVYDLAFAQQLKNKDLPEGGSKAVVLVEPRESRELSVKSFVDGLLDVLTSEQAKARGVDEYLFLGPDEQITPELIDWIVERAGHRGYPLARALMSSKPSSGINHKEFGVTSEGVVVFLAEALRQVGIEPTKDTFTLKMTGGPDGDVAGNLIRILDREYGNHARWVGIADGSGCAEDPDGLDTAALLELVDAEKAIAEFPREKLGAKGSLHTVDTEEGRRLRNTLYQRVVADAFVPAGGRPQTLHDHNWGSYLSDRGHASSKVIVEGANLFVTAGARKSLSQEGVLVVKDSSANKCGVICSSYEVAANMILPEDVWDEVKPRLVREVLERLRNVASLEARQLFIERHFFPKLTLPELSIRMSECILSVTDALEAKFQKDDSWKAFAHRCLKDHLPAVLMEYGAEQSLEALPPAYLRSMVASSMATRMVYREGIRFFGEAADEDLANIAMRYMEAELLTTKTDHPPNPEATRTQLLSTLARA